ncbi:TetR family transcriptional regulator [Gordonia jinhuaensis]|uniref:TetR family transcriptional regulator n=2 Tax=Gordonia jinhuaensis TaxID=1517702 RepID=A0A916WWV5_9ACTN|nr:TetR family transcriptional regulator [Gordonia jinhuaensis]
MEHIAREAEVSPTTFFRYFQTKEQVVAGDLAEARRAVFANMPPGLSRFGIIRELVTQLYRIAVEDEWISDPRRRALIRREPVLIAAHAAATERAIIEAREFIAAYLGVNPDDFGLRVFIGAVGGAMSTIAQGDAENPHGDGGLDELLRAVDLLECGLPVGS